MSRHRLLAVLLVAGLLPLAAPAQNPNLPNVRRLPDGTLEIVRPPPPATPAPRPRARPRTETITPNEGTRDEPGPTNEGVMIGSRSFRTVEAALAAAKAGDVVVLPPMIYRRGIVVARGGITLKGSPGTHFVGGAAQGKAAIVVAANDVTLDSIACADIFVPDKNGACVRGEGVNLTLRNVEFRDSETGILHVNRAGTVRIIDSVFSGLGRDSYAHSIYTSGERLHISGTRVAGARVGHEVKSRAPETVIEDSVITSGLAEDSRAVDVPDGGVLIMRRSVVHKGPRSQNFDMISVGKESRRNATTRVVLEDNVFIFDRPASLMFNLAPWVPAPELRNNLIVGGDGARWPGNRAHDDRAGAGLPPFPELPEAGRKP